jgi:ABC-type nitrate/sulfonate/bicarbonate transport system substrate-binding protein
MKSKQSLRVGGVPEHFNLPWQLAAERDVFSSKDIDLSWTMYAGGTGAMTQALSHGSLDVAILLTEGFIAAASDGLQAHIAKVYIETPLVWGIYTGAHSSIENADTFFNRHIAISRFGSGSHLMSMIHASERNEKIDPAQFEVVNSLHGGVNALCNSTADVFYWEKFMTRPHVLSGEVKLIGEFSAPWSSFLIIVGDEAMRNKKEAVKQLLQIMNGECITFKQDVHSAIQLSKRFDMSLPEAHAWLQNTQWNYTFEVSKQILENAKAALASVNKCNNQLNLEQFCAPWIQLN